MTGNEYQELAQRTSRKDINCPPIDPHIVNGVMGLNGEAGEVCDLVKKYMFQGHALEVAKLVDELGDCCWYIAEAAMGLGVTMEDIMYRNIEKLKARYPDGFSADRSVNRTE